MEGAELVEQDTSKAKIEGVNLMQRKGHKLLGCKGVNVGSKNEFQ